MSRRHRDLPCSPCPMHAQLLPLSTPPPPTPTRVAHFLQMMNLHRHIIIIQSPQFALGLILGVAWLISLDKFIMTYIYPGISNALQLLVRLLPTTCLRPPDDFFQLTVSLWFPFQAAFLQGSQTLFSGPSPYLDRRWEPCSGST